MQEKWEHASEALVEICRRCNGSQQARAVQTAHLMLRLGLEGAAPGLLQPAAGEQTTAERGVLKLIILLAPLCRQSCIDSVGRLQLLADGECAGSSEEIHSLTSTLFMCTRFVTDACNCVIMSPEDWGVAKCSSLHSILPLLECSLPTLDAALVLNSVARQLQVIACFFLIFL